MLNRRLDWQALGILLPKETDVAFHPPRCGIIPNRYRRPLMTPAAQAHAALHKYSYRFRLTETVLETPAYRWIPWRAFAEFEKAFAAADNTLGDAKRAVLDDYDEIRREVLETFTQLATDSANRLLATGYVVPTDFRERLTTNVLDALPSEAELRDGLTLKYQVGVILLGSEMLREQRQAAKERGKLEAAKAQESHERACQQVAEAAMQQELWEQRESARLRLVAQQEEQMREAAIKERIRQLKVEAAREKLNETLSPLQEGAAQLRASVYESAVAIHEALTKNEFLPGATAKKARNMAYWFRLMNFQSDAELERLIGELEGLASTGKKRRSADSAQVKNVLDDIIELCYRDAQTLAAPSRLAALEL
ncbi:MAG: hypothetical protein MSG64_19310 [Pyrinomonadaceae bacterium MAG19_C2-C3]|nr:hypothetical protein [Pyrinomonadaceae bacterium MAG19_C2-C3]